MTNLFRMPTWNKAVVKPRDFITTHSTRDPLYTASRLTWAHRLTVTNPQTTAVAVSHLRTCDATRQETGGVRLGAKQATPCHLHGSTSELAAVKISSRVDANAGCRTVGAIEFASSQTRYFDSKCGEADLWV